MTLLLQTMQATSKFLTDDANFQRDFWEISMAHTHFFLIELVRENAKITKNKTIFDTTRHETGCKW